MEQTLQSPNPIASKKWEGKVTTKLATTKADQIWSLFKDFFNLHKWYPTLSTSYGLYGSNGQPGCIRYCAGNSFSVEKPATEYEPSRVSQAGGSASWCKERLVAVDEEERSLSYEIVESNIGFYGYRSTVRICPIRSGGCVIEWSFSVDPVKGWRFEDLVRKYEAGLQRMALRMENFLGNSTN